MEKYSILRSETQKEYLLGCPVKVEKYNILLDNQTKQNVIQIKYKTLGDKIIKSVWTDIYCYDDAHDYITTVSDVAYININAVKGKSFGDKQPISVNTNSIGSIKVAVKKILFADESVWRNESGEIGIILPEQPSLKEYYGELYDRFVTASYKIKGKFEKVFNQTDKFWQCTCGQANTNDTINCIACGANVEQLKTISNPDYLKQNTLSIETKNSLAEQERVKAERERIEKEKIAKVKEAEENIKKENEKKLKRKKIIIAFVCVIFLCFYVAYYMISLNMICGNYDNTFIVSKTSPVTIEIFSMWSSDTIYSGLYLPNVITFGTYMDNTDHKYTIHNGYIHYHKKNVRISAIDTDPPVDLSSTYEKID